MGGAIVSRLIVLGGGTLYPAYASYKAVKSANVRLYVRWMMYWIIYAIFVTVETFTDLLLSWVPFYYEIKVGFLIWLLSPYTKGAAFLYRKYVHPFLSEKEPEIDNLFDSAKKRSYATVMDYGSRGINVATSAFVTAAVKSQVAMSDKLKSFSVNDISRLSDDTPVHSMDPISGFNPPIQREILRRSPEEHRRQLLTRPPLHQVERLPTVDVDINTFEVINPDNVLDDQLHVHDPATNDTQHDGVSMPSSGGGQMSPQYSPYKAYSMMDLSGTHDGSVLPQSLDFSSTPPEATVDDSYIPDSRVTFTRGDSAYSTLPRQRKSKKKKSEDPGSASSLRRSKRKVKPQVYQESDDEQQFIS